MELLKSIKTLTTCMLATGLLLAGCLGVEDEPDPVVDLGDEEVNVAGPSLLKHESFIDISLGTPVISFNQGAEDTYNIPLPVTGNTTGIILELHWTPESLLTENLDLWIRDASMGTIPPNDPMDLLENQPLMKVSGSSPLRLEVDVNDLEDIEYSILIRANSEPAGVAMDQPFTLHIATFEDLEFDASYEIDP